MKLPDWLKPKGKWVPVAEVQFWDWLDSQDMHLCRWEYVEGPELGDVFARDSHHHELIPLESEETEQIINRYIKEVRDG